MRIILFQFVLFLGAGLLCGVPNNAAAQGAPQASRRLVPVHLPDAKGKFGYVDKLGNVVVQPQFDRALEFSEGLGAVQVGGKWGKWGFIDETGRMVIQPRFHEVQPFADGMAMILTEDQETSRGRGPLYGFINRKGEVAVAPQYLAARDFGGGMTFVCLNQPVTPNHREADWRLIDRSGHSPCTHEFHLAGFFHEGLAVMAAPVENQEFKFGYIDPTSKVVIAPKFTWARPFCEDRAFVYLGGRYLGEKEGLEGGKWACIDRTGKVLFDKTPSGPWISPKGEYGPSVYHEGLALVQTKKRWIYLDRDGKTALGLKADRAHAFSEGLAAIQRKGQWDFIDKTGKTVIGPLQFKAVGDFSDGLAWFRIERKTDWKFPDGTPMGMEYPKGFIDKSGRVVIPPQYFEVTDFRDGIALVSDHEQGYAINHEGKRLGFVNRIDVVKFRLSEFSRRKN